MFTSPSEEYLLKKRSEARSASRVSPAHTESLRISSEILFDEAKQLEKAANQPIVDKPSWKGTGEIVNISAWPLKLARPDSRGRVDVSRPKSANRTRQRSSFGRTLPKERPKSAPRSRPLTKTPTGMLDAVNRLSTPKNRASSPVAFDDVQPPKKAHARDITSDTPPSPNLPSVVFRQLGKIKAQRRRSTVVAPLAGDDGLEVGKKPGYWASGANADDVTAVWLSVRELQQELMGHVHHSEFDRVVECQPVKEWVAARNSEDVTILMDDVDEEPESNIVFYDSDKPQFPSFQKWRKSNVESHGRGVEDDEASYEVCRRLYNRSGEFVNYEELVAIRAASDVCGFFLDGGSCSRLAKVDFEFLLGSASFSTNWVSKVLYRPVAKLIGGLLVDIKQSRACFRVTGFSAHVPPSVALHELALAGSIPHSDCLTCLHSDSSCHSKYNGDVGNTMKIKSEIDPIDHSMNSQAENCGEEDEMLTDMGNLSEHLTLGTEVESRTESLLSQQDTPLHVKPVAEQEWFRGCGCWTFDPSAHSETYGLLTPVAMITCAKRHLAAIRVLRNARVAKAKKLYENAMEASQLRLEQGKVAALLEKASQEAASLAEEEATYNAESINRKIEQHIREPWCKTLWSALWTGKLSTIQDCFEGMLEGDIIRDRTFKMFHCEVIVPPPSHGGAPVRVVRLEPPGAPESLRPIVTSGSGDFSLFYEGIVRRSLVYSCANALDAFLCMRKLVESTNQMLIAPPKADPETLPWLREHCGPETSPAEPISDALTLFDGTCSLSDENLFTSSMLLPTLGRQVVLDVPFELTGGKIEIPVTARSTYDSFREVDGRVVEGDSYTLTFDHSPDNSPTDSCSGPPQRKYSIEFSPVQLARKVLSEETVDDQEEEDKETKNKHAPFLHRKHSGTSLWWRLRQEQLTEQAREDSEVHYTKIKPFKYKPMNKGSLA